MSICFHVRTIVEMLFCHVSDRRDVTLAKATPCARCGHYLGAGITARKRTVVTPWSGVIEDHMHIQCDPSGRDPRRVSISLGSNSFS